MDCETNHTDNRWETYYGDVRWGFPSLRCPHSQGASASRLMRLLAQRTHTTCASQTLPVAVRDRRVAHALAPSPSSASLSSTSTSSIFTHRSTSTPPTTPPSSPFKSARSLLPSKDSSLVSFHPSLNTRTRSLERSIHLPLCHSQYARPPHHHASLLRSSLPRRKGNFRKITRKTIDFFREEMSGHGSFPRQCFPANDTLGSASSNIAVHVAEATLCSYEARVGFFGWRGLGLSEDVYSDISNLQPVIGIRRRLRPRRRTLDVLISEEEVEEGRAQWLEMVKEIIGHVPVRARHHTNVTPQPRDVRGRDLVSYDTPSQDPSKSIGQTRPVSSKNKGASHLREDKLVVKDLALGWRCSTPVAFSVGSVRTPFGYQPSSYMPHAPSGLGYSQVTGLSHNNIQASARCVSRGKDELSSTSESTSQLFHEPDPRSQVPSGCVSHPPSVLPMGMTGKTNGEVFYSRKSVSSLALRPPDALDSTRHSATGMMITSYKSEAIPTHSQSSLDSQTPVFPALNGGYVQDSSCHIAPPRGHDPKSDVGSDSANHEAAQSANRFTNSGRRSEQEERSTYSDTSPSPSLRALAGSPANGMGLRKDSQGFWEPVTPPCSPPAVRGRDAVSGRSRGSTAGSPSSSSSSPGSTLVSTPASTAVSSTTSPPPDSPSPYYSSEPQNSFESLGPPNPTSLLPAFFASAAKRKREKASRTREIVDRLKLGSGGEDDSGNDSRPVLDGGKASSRPPSQQTGTTMYSGSPDRQTATPRSANSASVPEIAVDLKVPTGASKLNPDPLPKHSSPSYSVSTAPVSGNEWIAPSRASNHGRAASGMPCNHSVCAVPAPSPIAPAATTTFQASVSPFPQPPCQPLTPHTVPLPNLRAQPPAPPVPVVRLPAQQQQPVVFYGPTYPVYGYPIAPPPPQPIGRGQGQFPWLVGYRPQQGGMHPPPQATPITGISGMRHASW
ncbi:hypothetical protein V8B97DRAFT_1319495 [Scleroderma yunnanense]